MLVTAEAASIDAVRALAPNGRITPTSFSTRIIRAGRRGPFVTTAQILAHTGDAITCRAEMIDAGRGHETIAISIWQCQLSR
jgi:hypothetical protein